MNRRAGLVFVKDLMIIFLNVKERNMINLILSGRFSKLFAVFLTLCFTSAVFFSCATRAKFQPSSIVPAAEGNVTMKKDGNNNYRLKVEVDHLAEPNRLPQPQNVYVVWAETPQGAQNLGQLKTASGLFSSKLKASLETVTPFKPSRIFVTAETTPTVTTPGYYTVLNTNVF
jgi:Zn-dependent protease with chaperone function